MPKDKEWHRQYEYEPIDLAVSRAMNQLLADSEIRLLLGWYLIGTRFLHKTAYQFCAVAEIWPDFCLHPTDPTLVMKPAEVHSMTSQGDIHWMFEEWFTQHRQAVVRKAVEELGFTWDEEEKLVR